MKDEDSLEKVLGKQVHLPFVLDQLGPRQLPAASARVLAAAVWGVLPNPRWLGAHGCEFGSVRGTKWSPIFHDKSNLAK